MERFNDRTHSKQKGRGKEEAIEKIEEMCSNRKNIWCLQRIRVRGAKTCLFMKLMLHIYFDTVIHMQARCHAK